MVGKDANGHGYVPQDLSGKYSPTEWARIAVSAYRTHRADRIVAERNNGGDMVQAMIRMVEPNVARCQQRKGDPGRTGQRPL